MINLIIKTVQFILINLFLYSVYLKMKKLVSIFLFCCLCIKSIACEVCGNGNAINAIGLLPQFAKSFIGLRYGKQTFNTTHPTGYGKETDQFKQFEITARYAASNRFQIAVSFPYAVNQQVGTSNIQSSGLGDVSLFLTHTTIPSKKLYQSNWYHALQFMLGFKMPSGKYKNDFSSSTFNEHLYPGSGSWDFIPALNYVITYKKFGLNIDFNAKFNSSNKLTYKMGNQFSGSMRWFYNKSLSSVNCIPFIALGFSKNNQDEFAINNVAYTGGEELNYQFGADVKIKSYLIGFQYLKPLVQNWNDTYTIHDAKLNVRLLYFFK
jgi:hypothetical protein